MKRLIFTFSVFFFVLVVAHAQTTDSTSSTKPEEKYYGQENSYTKFKKDQKKFRSWWVGLYAGTNFITNGDLVSIDNGNNDEYLPGYDFHAVVVKQISHTFGLGLQFNYGQTTQEFSDIRQAETEYLTFGVLGDLNVSSLFRRVDNKSKYKFALHAYALAGGMDYEATREDLTTGTGAPLIVVDQNFALDEFGFFFGIGSGLRYKLSNAIDLEAKGMFYFTGDDEFDGCGSEPLVILDCQVEEGDDDSYVSLNLGLIYKVGGNKENESLQWYDPLAILYPPNNLDSAIDGIRYCEEDIDDDGVCDDTDRQLDTPIGSRVDGAGVALDVDNDTVIDLFDACITVPGVPSENDSLNGCPPPIIIESIEEVINILNKELQGIEFELDKAVIREKSYGNLDRAANVIIRYPEYTYIIEGHTDAYGDFDYNLDLSQRRAQAVADYIVDAGVERYKLRAVGKGESDLKLKKCNPANLCTDEENEYNRRVVFIPGTLEGEKIIDVKKTVEKIESSNNPLEQYQNQQKYNK